MFLRLFACLFVFLFLGRSSPASTDIRYPDEKTFSMGFAERAQEENGYASGFSVSDLSAYDLLTPHFEIGTRIRFIGGYGPASVLNFATYNGINTTGPQAPTGFDRPILRARHLIYGSYNMGRWYILELGLPIFNVSGFVGEYFHYWSQRIALHETLKFSHFEGNLEIGATVRSITQFLVPTNTALIYPPTIEGLAGIERDFFGIHIATDLKIEQALTDITTAGSYDNSTISPYGASTRLQVGVELGYHLSPHTNFILRGAQRIYRWPDTDNSALWATFDEATLGRSLELSWRGSW